MLPAGLTSGYYGVDGRGRAVEVGAVKEDICPRGYYCGGGVKVACERGEYCQEGSTAPVKCARGYYCTTPETKSACIPGQYCPEGSTEPSNCVDGATCTNPGSPELVILPSALLELRESEVLADTGGWIEYNISLSAAPRSTVRIMVQKRNDANLLECVKYDDGLKLYTTELEFASYNFNISQTVKIQMDRDTDIFQGSAFASFVHSVQSQVRAHSPMY